jgi:outer membrane protein
MKLSRPVLLAALLASAGALAQPQPTTPSPSKPQPQPGVTSPATTAPGQTPAAPLPPATPSPTSPNGTPTTAGTPDTPTPGAPPPVDWLNGVTDLTTGVPAGVVTLTLDHAVELALKTQPTLREAKAAAEANFGHVDQARVARHPVVNVNAGLVVASSQLCNNAVIPGTGSGSGTSMQTVVGETPCGGFFHPALSAPLGASASWRLTDFGLTDANIAVAELNAEASVASIDSSALDVRLSVESAYLLSVAANRLTKVAAVTVKSNADHLDQAKRFVAAQAHDPIEVAQAQAAYANAKAALAQAQSNEATALANLRAAIGYVELQGALVVDPNWPVPPAEDPPDLKALVESAREHRPEIIAVDKQLASADASITAAEKERMPILAATASTGWTPSQYNWDPQPSWTAGVSLSWQLWDGGKSRADVRVADANVVNTKAQRDALLVSITSTLDAARASIITNRGAVDSSNEAVTAARAQLRLSEARYAQGLGSQIELADAQTAVTTAEGNLVSSEYQLALAWATLRRALGQS